MRGYSLVELLVAVALFAVIAAIVYGGLDRLAGGSAQLAEAAQRLSALQRGIDRFGDDVRQAVARPVRGAQGEPLPALSGEPMRVELTRGGHGNALALPRAELERVGWQLADGQLQRLRWPVLDRVPESAPRADTLLDQVERIELRYIDARGAAHVRWPVPGAATPLPRAVELRLQLADQGEIRRLYELAEGAP